MFLSILPPCSSNIQAHLCIYKRSCRLQTRRSDWGSFSPSEVWLSSKEEKPTEAACSGEIQRSGCSPHEIVCLSPDLAMGPTLTPAVMIFPKWGIWTIIILVQLSLACVLIVRAAPSVSVSLNRAAFECCNTESDSNCK